MSVSKKMVIVSLVIVLAVASIGLGYAATYKGEVKSQDNFNEVGVYALHIYEGASEVLAPLQLDQPQFSAGVSQTGHKCVIIEDNVVNSPEYTLVTDGTDGSKGAHIRMWIFFDNAVMWALVDKIELTVWDDGLERTSFVCGVSGSTSGLCTGVIELTPFVLTHEFIITVTYKSSVDMDYVELNDAIRDAKTTAVFVYDDVDPISGK